MAKIVLQTLRKNIVEDGLLVTTIRPKDFLHIHGKGAFATQMIEIHKERICLYTPQSPPIDGDETYGESSMSLAYFEGHYPQWKKESFECYNCYPHKNFIFLKPA